MNYNLRLCFQNKILIDTSNLMITTIFIVQNFDGKSIAEYEKTILTNKPYTLRLKSIYFRVKNIGGQI